MGSIPVGVTKEKYQGHFVLDTFLKYTKGRNGMEEKKIADKIWINIIIAVIIMLYFIGINIAYNTLNQDYTIVILKTASIIIMSISIIIFEISYKKDSGITGIIGIEVLVIAMHTLSVMHVVISSSFDFKTYITASSYIFALYYVMKSILIYTNEKRKYLKSLSDIKEIVINEPVKKEARKTNLKKNNN